MQLTPTAIASNRFTLEVDELDTMTVEVNPGIGVLIIAPNGKDIFLTDAMLERVVDAYKKQTIKTKLETQSNSHTKVKEQGQC